MYVAMYYIFIGVVKYILFYFKCIAMYYLLVGITIKDFLIYYIRYILKNGFG